MMTEDKSKLLRSLKIDRSTDKTERSGSRWLPISAAIIACVVGFAAFAAFEFRRQDPPKETVQQSVAQPQTPQLPQQTATSSKPAGTLAASGYVVARRKATVAAEITGKVVEVFIDEGMTVTEGQVVARLDSVLAEKDFDLAEVKSLLEKAAGVVVVDNPANHEYPMPKDAHNRDEVFVGRLRRDESQPNTLNMWIVSDNLRKGAATNAVQIAEYLVEKGLV